MTDVRGESRRFAMTGDSTQGSDMLGKFGPWRCSTRTGSGFRLLFDVRYSQLLANKSVAIVGPARTLLGRKQGQLIDLHDLVVRVNDAFELLPIPTNLAEDIGSRTDILYCNQAILKNNVLTRGRQSRDQLLSLLGDAHVKFIVCTNNSLSYTRTGDPTSTCPRQDLQIICDLREILAGARRHPAPPGRAESEIQVRVVRTASEMLAHWLQGNWARTGLVAILDLLTFDIRRLFITGMTFYHGGGHLLSSASVELHPLKNRDGTWARSASGLGHDSYLELDVMRVLARCFRDRLEIDRGLSDLLNR